MVHTVIGFMLIAVMLAFSNIFGLKIWSQIEYINLMDKLDFFEPALLVHIPRFFVVYPSYYFGKIFDIDENLAYTIYVILLASLTSIIWIKIQRMLVNNNKFRNYSFVIPFLLLFIINGRFMFALFGLSLLMMCLVELRLKINRPFVLGVILFSLLYTSVSSGTFSIAVLFLIATSFRVLLNYLMVKQILVRMINIVFLSLISTFLAYLTILFLQKNLDYYGGGFEGVANIISHGAGLVFNPEPLLDSCSFEGGLICSFSLFLLSDSVYQAVFILFFVILFFAILSYLYLSNLHLFAKQAIFISLVGGIFGFTAFMSIIFVAPVFLSRSKLRGDF